MDLSNEAHDGWSRFAAENGVPLTALMEILGKHMGKNPSPLKQEAKDAILKEARALAHERRKAGGPRRKT
jgi:hypothetical protein